MLCIPRASIPLMRWVWHWPPGHCDLSTFLVAAHPHCGKFDFGSGTSQGFPTTLAVLSWTEVHALCGHVPTWPLAEHCHNPAIPGEPLSLKRAWLTGSTPSVIVGTCRTLRGLSGVTEMGDRWQRRACPSVPPPAKPLWQLSCPQPHETSPSHTS